MEDLLHHPNIGAQIRSATRHSLDMSHCSPCHLKLSDGPPPAHDYPYDTARCDFHCVGKWEPALHRFAIYLLHKLNDRLARIGAALERNGLALPHPDDTDVTLRLSVDGAEYTFRLRTVRHGHLRWQGASTGVGKGHG